jgi:hypothetical protein
MGNPMNIEVIKSADILSDSKNTVPFEVEAPIKPNYYNSDVLMIDLSELVDTNPGEISDYEKQMTKVFLNTLLVDLDTKVIIDITTTPYELACLFLTVIRSMPLNPACIER